MDPNLTTGTDGTGTPPNEEAIAEGAPAPTEGNPKPDDKAPAPSDPPAADDKATTPPAGDTKDQKDEKPEPDPVVEIESMAGLAEKAGLDPQELGKLYTEQGKLNDEHYEAIRKQFPGASRGFIDETLGYMQRHNQQVHEAWSYSKELAGGELQHQNVMNWAKANRPDLYNQMVADLYQSPMSITKHTRTIMDEHRKELGGGGGRPTGNNAPGEGGATPFADQAEQVAAAGDPAILPKIGMKKNPQYDPKKRAEYLARLKATIDQRKKSS